MSAISAWLMGILAIVIVGVVFDLLLSESRMHKFIQTVFATVTILVIIIPIPNMIKNGIDFDKGFIFDTEIKLDDSYIEYINKAKAESLSRGLEKALHEDGLQNVKVEITANFGEDIEIKSVKINLQNLVIAPDLQHINKYEYLREKVTKYLNISGDKILIYE